MALVAAIGFGMITVSYAGARSGASWSSACYWCGELVMFLPLVARAVLAHDLPRGEAIGLVVVGALLSYLVRYAYSPHMFSFADELSHTQTADQILRTHHLFSPNYLLPVSPQYPGLELVTVALSSIGGASVFASGVIVLGAAHMLLIVTLFALLRCASGSARLASLGALVYETNPHYQFFDSFFIYQNIAIPLLLVVLLAVSSDGGMLADRVRGGRPPVGTRIAVRAVALLAAAAVAISHHVTLIALLCVLALLAAFHAFFSRARRMRFVSRASVRPILVMTLITAALAAVWVLLAATQTLQYLSPTFNDVTSSAAGLFGRRASVAGSAAASTPLADLILTYALAAIVAFALPWGIWSTLRSRRSGLAVFLAILSLGYYGLIALRLISPDGAELAGRAFTFIYVPVSFVLAAAALRLRRMRWPPIVTAGVIVGAFAILFAGGLASGWPPPWERLPGGYQVSGLERSLSPPDYAVARWFASAVPSGSRVAVDLADYPLVGSIGNQDVIRNGGQLFYSQTLEPSDESFVRRSSVRYVVTDQRLTTAFPASGRYFPDDPRAYEHRTPIALSALTKFNRIPGVSRIYDNGPIAVYDLSGSAYSP